ncbi:MAG TPA: hypothetical protein VHM92_13630 [Allosphingosinicella sp.]|nr:hypothetical protein [Allosphingosinicella sp.]
MRILLTAALLLAPAAVGAGTPTVQKMTCPIGGAGFDYKTTVSYSTWGERPDGKPYGSWTFPLALPECPDNGLVLYKEYDAEEVAKLEPLVASEAYQALRKADTPYYRAYWLMKAMGLGPERYLWALLQASWEAEGRGELRARYLAELADSSAKVPARPGDMNWIGMEARAANALRELGRFDEAMARLDNVPLTGLDAAMPTGAAATPQAIAEVRTRRGWLAFIRGLKVAIARRDASIEPLDLIPRSIAVGRCIDAAVSLDEAGRVYCEKEKAAVDELRLAREKLKALPDKSGR